METNCDDAEKSKAGYLGHNTRYGNVFSPVDFRFCVRICWLGARNDDGPYELDEEGECIAGDKYGCDKPRWNPEKLGRHCLQWHNMVYDSPENDIKGRGHHNRRQDDHTELDDKYCTVVWL
jgi:hypothetical protein